MERKYGVTQAIREFVAERPYSDAFTVDDVMRATEHAYPRASVRATLHAEVGRSDLKQYDSGIWYKAGIIPSLGVEDAPNLVPLIDSLWMTNDCGVRIGYETGAYLANRWNLSTQIPNKMDVVTQRPNRKPEIARQLGVRLRAPITDITAANWRNLQVLDMLDSGVNLDNDRNGRRLAEIMSREEISYVELMSLAFLFYPKRVQNLVVQLSERIVNVSA